MRPANTQISLVICPVWSKFSLSAWRCCLSDQGFRCLHEDVVCSGLRRFQQFFSHIMTVSGCDRELNAHLDSAASLKYHAPGTWYDTTPSHISLTLGWPVLALVWVPSEEQLVPFLMALVCHGPGLNLWPPVPRSGHSTYWAIEAGLPHEETFGP